MFALFVVAVSLLTQVYVFRDAPSRTMDGCHAETVSCPEDALDSIFARQNEELERYRRLAACPKADDPGRMAARAAGRAPDKVDSVRLETCLGPE